ncbi:MAG: hypothetical protein RLN72_04160, partial [Henriciella sp.]
MRRCLIAMAVLAAAALPAFAQDLAIVNARVFTANDPITLENATVIVRDGRIEAVGEALPVPDDLDALDAQGQWLTPGLMNGATQIGLVEMGSVGAAKDSRDEHAPIGPNLDVSYAINANSTVIPLARADGLTMAAIVPEQSGESPFAGLPAVIRLSPGGDIVAKPRAGVAVIAGGTTDGSRAAHWTLVRRALDMAGEERRDRRGSGAHGTDDKHEFMRRVLDRDIPLVISANRESDLRQAIALADDYGIRIIIIGAAEAWRAASDLAARDISVVINPILNLPESFDMIGAKNTNARDIALAGVPIAFMSFSIHTTYNAGLGIREAAGTGVAHGLPWRDAMIGLTRTPAEMWGVGDTYGQLAPGFVADMVLWDGDPLEPSTQATHVWIDGAPADLTTRQDLLAARYIAR